MRLLTTGLLAGASALAAAFPAYAQDADAQLWTATTATLPLDDDTEFAASLVARFGDAANGPTQLQFGLDLDRSIGDGLRLGIGYSYVPSYDQGRVTTREHRIRQQVSGTVARIGGGELAGRLRLEQRWRDDGEDTKFRLRPRITWTRPLGPDGFALRLLHESFVNLNDTDWGDEARYDRMRNQVALRHRLAPGVTGETGYLNQYIFQGARPDEVDHALTLALSFSL